MVKRRILIFLVLVSQGCIPAGEDVGLKVNPDAVHGPSIVFDPLKRPIPDIPFPNDLILRPDDGTSTGVSWNTSAERTSEHQCWQMLR